MTKAEQILIKHNMEFRDEFINTPRARKQKQNILNAMEEFRNSTPNKGVRVELHKSDK